MITTGVGQARQVNNYNKQLLDDVEYDIMNYQNRGLCYLPKPKAEADNTDKYKKHKKTVAKTPSKVNMTGLMHYYVTSSNSYQASFARNALQPQASCCFHDDILFIFAALSICPR